MKELSIEEKAKAYDKAYKKVAIRFGSNVADEIFLKESKDERIRKALINTFKYYHTNESPYMDGISNESVVAYLEKQGKQKPAWSEEDEDYYDAIIAKLEVTQDDASLTDNQMEFLKSLKDRFVPQSKQEWSDEDERIRIETIELLETANHPNKMHSNGKPLDFTENINWLKSLKERYTWKPSDEQMLAINTAINVIGKVTLSGKQLIELQEQLKKLRER